MHQTMWILAAGLVAFLLFESYAQAGSTIDERPTRIDFALALDSYNSGNACIDKGDAKQAKDFYRRGARLGLPPAQVMLALLLEDSAQEEAYFWSKVALALMGDDVLSTLPIPAPWMLSGLRIQVDLSALHDLNRRLAARISSADEMRSIDLMRESWVMEHKLLWLKAQQKQAEADEADPIRKKARDGIKYLEQFGIIGVSCNQDGTLGDCQRSGLAPSMPADKCLKYLKAGGFGDPCATLIKSIP